MRPETNPEQLLESDDFVRRFAAKVMAHTESTRDLVQEAWLARLRAGDAPTTNTEGWFGTVIKRLTWKSRTAATRREARERLTARSELVPSAREIAEREELRRRMIDEIMKLDEIYRTVLLLRFYRDMSPKEIATTLSLPSETVRTRMKRGLAMLRERLGAVNGRKESLHLLGVLAFAGQKSPMVAALKTIVADKWIGGFGLMSTQMKSAIAAAVILIVGFVTTETLRGDSRGTEERIDGTTIVATNEIATVRRAPRHPQPIAVLETAQPTDDLAEAPEKTGSLRIFVVKSLDGKPAAGQWVRVLEFGLDSPDLNERWVKTDADGKAVVDGLAIGDASVEALLAGSGVKATVKADEATDVSLRIDPGSRIECEVVDAAGRPVPSAEIFLSSRYDNHSLLMIGRSDRDGRFNVDDVEMELYRVVAATHPDWSPSRGRLLHSDVGATHRVTLVLGAVGGTLTGIVRDAEGKPIEDALVVVGSRSPMQAVGQSGEHFVPPAPIRTRTDAAGKFSLSGVPVGREAILVQHRDHALYASTVDIRAGSARDITVTLEKGVVLSGRVFAKDDSPVENASIRVENLGVPDTRFGTHSKADGSYRLRGLPTGKWSIVAEHEKYGLLSAEFEAEPRTLIRWDPTLRTGASIELEIVNEKAEPVPAVFCGLVTVGNPNSGSVRNQRTDARGRVRFVGLRGDAFEIHIRSPNCSSVTVKRLHNVRTGGDPIVVRLEREAFGTTSIGGRVVDENGAPIPQVSANITRAGSGSGSLLLTDAETGSFLWSKYPAGDYVLRLDRPGFAPIELPVTVGIGETKDLGTIRMSRPGHVSIAIDRSSCPKARDLIASFAGDGQPGTATMFDGAEAHSGPLAPGEYRVTIFGDGIANETATVTVVGGKTATISMRLRVGAIIEPIVREKLGSAPPDSAEIILFGREEKVLENKSISRGADGFLRTKFSLEPGTYRAVAKSKDGRTGSITFTIDADGRPSGEIMQIDVE